MSDKQAIVMDIKGIKCDAADCDYEDMSVEFDPEKWLNAPCPKCGANLFTPEDHKTYTTMLHMIGKVNEVAAEILPDEAFIDEPVVNYSINMDGTGIPKSITKQDIGQGLSTEET